MRSNLTGNVTIDPQAPAVAVNDPTGVREVRDLRSGALWEATRFIEGRTWRAVVLIRNLIKEANLTDQPRLVCSVCGVPVNMVGSPKKAMFFRHTIEDGRCPARTRGAQTEDQIRAMKYMGARESDAHKKMKERIVRSLVADPAFSDIRQENRFKAETGPEYRQPDVQATRNVLRIAFEAQLSTTFLDVVAGRRVFYRQHGALLVWALPAFYPADRRMTEEDIWIPNNCNAIVVDNETAAASESSGKFVVKCWYQRPFIEAAAIRFSWECAVVGFDQLTLDQDGQRTFFYDVDQERRRLQGELDREALRRQQEQAEENLRRQREIAKRRSAESDRLFRAKVLDFYRSWADHTPADSLAWWADLSGGFRARGLTVPSNPGTNALRAPVHVLLSGQEGRPIGFGFEKLVELAHHVANLYPRLLIPFGFAIRLSAIPTVLEQEDHTGRWETKRSNLRAAITDAPENYTPEQLMWPAVSFLFPEIAAQVDNFFAQRMPN